MAHTVVLEKLLDTFSTIYFVEMKTLNFEVYDIFVDTYHFAD